MARRIVRRAAGSQAPQRQIANDGFDGTATITFGGSTVGTAQGSVGFQVLVPALTLVRTRGIFSAVVTVAGASTAIIQGAMGIIVASGESFAAGLVSLSTPMDDIERAWVVWQPFSVYADVGGAITEAAGTAAFSREAVDSRGMRKMKVNDVLSVVFEATQLVGTTGTVVKFSYNLRQQFKL